MFGAATNTNKYCAATGGPVLARCEHVTGGLVAAAARDLLLAAHGWVGGPRGRWYQLFTHCFLTLHQVSLLHQVSAKVCSCAWCWRFERFLTQGDLVKVFHFSLCTTGVKRHGRKVADDTLSDIFFKIWSSWLGFHRTKVSISTKKQEIEDVIGNLEVPDDVLFFCGNRCTSVIETEPWL